MFSTLSITKFIVCVTFISLFAKSFKLDWSKILLFGRVKSLPSDKIWAPFKLKAFADNKSSVTQNLKFVLGREENIVGKGENAGHQYFLPFQQCFQKPSFSGLSGLCGQFNSSAESIDPGQPEQT